MQVHASVLRFVTALGIATSSHGRRTEALPQIHLAGASSSGPYETVKAWIALFSASYPEAHLTLSNVSSGAAKSALWGDIDCAMNPVYDLCEDLGKDEFGTTLWGIGAVPFTTSDYGNHTSLQLQQLPVLGGPVIPVYSKDVTGNLGLMTDLAFNMTFDIIAGIFNGSIAVWDDPVIAAVNPGLTLPNEKITVFVREDRSGLSEKLTEAIHCAVPEWPDDAIGNLPIWPLKNLSHISVISSPDIYHFKANGQVGVVHGLLRRPYSIGYLDLVHLSALNQFVSQAHVSSDENSNKFLSVDNVTLHKAINGFGEVTDPTLHNSNPIKEEAPKDRYPIMQYLNWYVKRNHTEYDDCYQAWLLCTFIQWTYTDPRAVDIALEHGWVVPSPIEALTKLKEIKCIDIETTDRWGTPLAISALDYTPIPYRHNMNEIGKVRSVGWNFGIIIIVSSLIFSTWVLWKVDDHIVRASQPEFLYMICFGAFAMGCSLFPLGVDESFSNAKECDIACMAFPWLITCGFSISFSALFSKTWRINRLFHGSRFRKMKVRVKDVMKPFYVIFTLNVVFLTAWTLVDPFKWKRIHIDLVNSYGTCQGDGIASVVFIVLILFVNGSALVLANIQSFKARGISDEFSEHRYVGLAMASMLQIFTVGLPLSFLVKKNPSARFFVFSCIIFVVAMSLLLFIFVPKMLYRETRKSGRQAGTISAYSTTKKTSDNFSTNSAVRTVYNPSLQHGTRQQNCDIKSKLEEYEKRLSMLGVRLNQQGFDAESLFDEVGMPSMTTAGDKRGRNKTEMPINDYATVTFSLPKENSTALPAMASNSSLSKLEAATSTSPNNNTSSLKENLSVLSSQVSDDFSPKSPALTMLTSNP
mmetsp:Transcript_45324/g.66746  ORF Transcript_45324/g.66746 Transcript_45324/m.66746 type:complete len:866 (+) Transcript_45324:107-2704(+)